MQSRKLDILKNLKSRDNEKLQDFSNFLEHFFFKLILDMNV